MCNCIEEWVDRMKPQIPELIKKRDRRFTKLISFWLKDLIFSMSDKPTPPFRIHFSAKYEYKQKNGVVKEKDFQVSLMPTFCPLCGKEYE